MTLVGCPKKPSPATDAGPEDAAPPAVEAAAAPLAANEAAVTRYPDESAVNHVPQSTRWAVANVRTQASPSGGELVAVIKAGTEVDKIADRQGFSLIVFTDPSDASRKDMGWVSAVVFTPEPPHKHVPVHCGAGQAAILLQSGEECVTPCTQDANCPKGTVCNGAGVLSNNGAPGAATKFCGPSAGPATGPDAGGGAGPTPPSAPDAGAPSKKLDVKKGADGKCPGGYGACGVICRLQCGKDADCGVPGAHCQGGFCLGPGAVPCGK
jgi:hypothetical protein